MIYFLLTAHLIGSQATTQLDAQTFLIVASLRREVGSSTIMLTFSFSACTVLQNGILYVSLQQHTPAPKVLRPLGPKMGIHSRSCRDVGVFGSSVAIEPHGV